MRILITKGRNAYGQTKVYIRSYYSDSSWLVGEAKMIVGGKEIVVHGWVRYAKEKMGGCFVRKVWRGCNENTFESAWRYTYRIATGIKF